MISAGSGLALGWKEATAVDSALEMCLLGLWVGCLSC
jgi:hypothetical protein